MKTRMDWMMSATALVGVMALLAGCSSMEDRIENVVEHELDECKQADERFHEVTTHGGESYEVLAELCHLEPSDVEMHTDWRGSIKTGPLMWTAEEDQDDSTVYLNRVAWDELDRARSAAGSDDPEVLEEAEEHFAEAQSQYGDSGWLRLQRLDNLLDLRAERRSDEVGGSLVGDDVDELLAELIDWADSEDEPETAVRARLQVLNHLDDYIGGQESSIDAFGAQDNRLEAAIEHADEAGDTEEMEQYEEELQERRERRPEARAELEERIRDARTEGCDHIDELEVGDVDDDQLADRVEATVDDFDCEALDEQQQSDDEDERDDD